MSFRKKVLYYGLLLFLTILALEGMGRVAYYAAYNQWYGGGRPARPANYYLPPPPHINQASTTKELAPRLIRHPFYGFADGSPGNALNAMPPRPRQEDRVVIGLLGGSVAEQVRPFLQRALTRWFAANQLPQQPIVSELAGGNVKQPQQTMVVANTLLLGGEFDLIINLDGVNEVTAVQGLGEGIVPFFPLNWSRLVGLTGAEISLAGHIAVLRREQARLTAVSETSPLRRSALFGLANRYRQERTAAQIIQLNHELAATAADYNLEKHGPRRRSAPPAAVRQAAARIWYRSSLTLSRLAAVVGADYYHFCSPTSMCRIPNR